MRVRGCGAASRGGDRRRRCRSRARRATPPARRSTRGRRSRRAARTSRTRPTSGRPCVATPCRPASGGRPAPTRRARRRPRLACPSGRWRPTWWPTRRRRAWSTRRRTPCARRSARSASELCGALAHGQRCALLLPRPEEQSDREHHGVTEDRHLRLGGGGCRVARHLARDLRRRLRAGGGAAADANACCASSKSNVRRCPAGLIVTSPAISAINTTGASMAGRNRPGAKTPRRRPHGPFDEPVAEHRQQDREADHEQEPGQVREAGAPLVEEDEQRPVEEVHAVGDDAEPAQRLHPEETVDRPVGNGRGEDHHDREHRDGGEPAGVDQRTAIGDQHPRGDRDHQRHHPGHRDDRSRPEPLEEVPPDTRAATGPRPAPRRRAARRPGCRCRSRRGRGWRPPGSGSSTTPARRAPARRRADRGDAEAAPPDPGAAAGRRGRTAPRSPGSRSGAPATGDWKRLP